ncbi:MAG: hypothetical protein ACJ8GK_08900 [Luteimonas sp.]
MSRHLVAVLPVFPGQAIRTAASEGDWVRAADLVDGHDRAVRAAFVDPPDEQTRADWLGLMREQQALMLELQQERERSSATLRQLEHERRSAQHYLSQMRSGEAGE